MRKINRALPLFARKAACRLAVVLAAGVWVLPAFGALHPVTRDEARQIARRWLAFHVQRSGGWAGSRRPKIHRTWELSTPDGTVLGYAIDIVPVGHIVVPGIRELPPIKAYSTTQSFPAAKDRYARAVVADLAAARTALERAQTQPTREGIDPSANLESWATFLKVDRDAYTGVQGVVFARHDPLLDDLDRWDPQRQPVGDRSRYSGNLAWHPYTPLNSKLPRVRTVPEEIWIDRDGNGVLKLGDVEDAIAYDADLNWVSEEDTPGSNRGIYYYDAAGIGTYRRYSTDQDELALDPVHFTAVFGQGYDIWKDEEGGTPGQYDQAFDSRVYDGGDGWQTPDGSLGIQTDIYYNDADFSRDYTNWYGYPLLGGAAVAFGEIMRYWEWPDVGRGSHSYQWAYHEDGQDPEQVITLGANFEHPYTWRQMPLWGLHDGFATDAEINEVARLLADVGICFETDFQRASPVMNFSDENLARFAYHFQYNANAIRLRKRAEYSSDDAWFELIRAELDAHRPVMLVPYKDEATIHPLVADGYDRLAGAANLYLLHCNMGWDGVADFWYALDNIGGMPGGAVDGALGAVQLQQAVVNILPNRTRRTVVAELFRRTADPRGNTVSATLGDLQNEYGNSQLLVLAYHPDPADPLYPQDAATQQFMAERATDLRVSADDISQGVRTVTVFDADPTQAYDTVAADTDDPAPILGGQIERRLATKAAFRIVGDAVVANAGAGSPDGLPFLTADVYVTSLDENVELWTNLRLHVFLAEGALDEGGTTYSWVVRRLLLTRDLTLGTGETEVISIGPVHPEEILDMANATVAAVLEDTQTGRILQAGVLDRRNYGHPYLANQPPTSPLQVTLSQVFDAGVLQALEVTPEGAEDVDGDRLTYLVRWYKNGVQLAGPAEENHFVLTAAEAGGFADGDIWFCDVRVRDAFYYAVDAQLTQALMFQLKQTNPYLGSPLTDLRDSHETTPTTSNMVVIVGELPAINQPPTAPSLVQLSNPAPAATEDVRCLPGGSTDPEDDRFSYVFAWFRYDAGTDTFLAVPEQTRSLLPADATQTDEQWLCKVAARDHWGAQSAWVESAQFTIGQPDPSAPTKPIHASITPGIPSYVSDLTCSTPTGVTAPGPFQVHYRWWKRTGPTWELTDLTGPTVDKGMLAVGEAWACEVYAVSTDTGAQGASLTTEEVVIRNFAPADPVVSAFPSIAGADEEIRCNVSGAIDPEDGTNVTVDYRWYVNGEFSGIETETVPADATSAGENWFCRVYAQDTLGARSRTVQTGTVIIGTRPTPPTEVLLLPVTPEVEDNLTCVASGSVDADGDVVRYLFTWYRQGLIQEGLNTSTVPAELTGYGEFWRCEVRAYDGLLSSAPVSTIEVRIGGNEPPSAPAVEIRPDPATPGESLECVVTEESEDPDGQAVTYFFTWYRDQQKTDYTGAVLPAGVTAEGETWQCHVYAQDPEGARSSTASSQLISLVNEPPGAPAEVSVSPAAPKTDTPLQCTASGAADPNGDPVTYVFEWFYYTDDPANPTQSATTTSSLPAAETADGQNWYCEVYGVDSHGAAGTRKRSNVVTIGDVAPEAPTQVVVSPVPAGIGQDLVCTAAGATDPNGDPVTYLYQWYKNGNPVVGETDYRLSASLLAVGDNWLCHVQASDGTHISAEAVSNEVNIQNLPPIGPDTAEIAPATPTELDDLACVPSGANDPEGEAVRFTYRWYRNGDATGYDGARLPATATAVGESWFCTVTATDPEGLAAPAVTTDPVTILSAAPSTPSVQVTPSNPTVGQTLTCTAAGAEDPLGGEITYLFQWFRNDVPEAGFTSAEVGPAATHTGDIWKCVVRARNSQGFESAAITSNEVVVNNNPPSAPTVVVQPRAPRPGAAIQCVASGSVDPDGHAVVYTFEWYKDGAAAGIATATVPENTTAAGEVWECRVTAADAYGAAAPVVISTPVTVGNEAPAAPAVTVTPEVPVVGGTLTCNAAGATDPNGDTVTYIYRWQNDAGAGAWSDSGDTGPTVGPLGQDGWAWRCIVQATDGDLTSAEVTSNEVTVTGHAPTVPTVVQVAPAEPGVTNDLVCTASGSTDADSDAVSYVFLWYRNGVPTGLTGTLTVNGNTWTSTLSADFTGDGETWNCAVHARDARNATSDAVRSNSVTIQEPPPPPPNAAQIFPPIPTVNNALRCVVDAPSVDDNGNPIANVFSWSKDGQVQSAYTGPTVPAAATALNERWVCEVRTRNAAGALSDPLRSDEVIIGAAGNDAFENDDERESATEIVSGSFQAHGLDAADPGDWLRFRIDRLSEVRVDVEVLTGQAQPKLSLYRAGEADPFLEQTGAPIRVSGIWRPGVYEARVQAATRGADTWFYGFRLNVSDATALGTDTGAPADYTVNSSLPARWFYLVLTENTTITLTSDIIAGQADLVLSIYDASGNGIAQSQAGGTTLTATLSTGVYFVQLAGENFSTGRALDDVHGTLTLTADDSVPANHAPQAPLFIQVLPENPAPNSRLVAVANGAIDPDAVSQSENGQTPDPAQDVELAYYWYRNGEYVPDWTTREVPGAAVQDGDTWYCTVVARDGYSAGTEPSQSNIVTVGSLPEWTVSIQALGAATDALAIGLSKQATDDWDSGVDDVAPPADPDAATGRVYLLGPDDHPELSKDVRAAGGTHVFWYLRITNRDAVDLTWDASSVPAGSALEIAEVDAATWTVLPGTEVDMLTNDGLDLAGAGDDATFRIAFAAGNLQYETVALEKGWNLISFWLQGEFDDASQVFQGIAQGSVWYYDAAVHAYRTAQTVTPMTGYWVYAVVPAELQHIGFPTTDGARTLVRGWDLAGPLADIPVPGAAGIQAVWGWNGAAYEAPVLLQRGRAYWFFTTSETTVDLK